MNNFNRNKLTIYINNDKKTFSYYLLKKFFSLYILAIFTYTKTNKKMKNLEIIPLQVISIRNKYAIVIGKNQGVTLDDTSFFVKTTDGIIEYNGKEMIEVYELNSKELVQLSNLV